MDITITPAGDLEILGQDICLRGGRPLVNAHVLNDRPVELPGEKADRRLIRFQSAVLGEGAFYLEIYQENSSDRFWLRYWLEGCDPSGQLDSFGLRFEEIENLRAYFRNGYTSWDGSAFVDVESLADFGSQDVRPEQGYAMTQLLPRQGEAALVLGFDRHDRFQHIFSFETCCCPPALIVQTCWDQKDRIDLPRCESERLVIFEDKQVESGLRDWACLVARSSPLPPRVHHEPIKGWSSWYNLYAAINEEMVLEYLVHTRSTCDREKLPMQVFQIDDGFTPEMGDWLEVKPQFPRGMKPLLDEVRAAGFIPGLWIAPFMVGNRSHLFREHPDWVLKERRTDCPLVQWRHVGEYRWHKLSEEYYILDATHPDAFEYLRRVFRIWRKEWGCEYFKTDFMHYGSEYGPDRVAWHTPGLTRIEVWRKVAEMIRSEIGDAIWLGSGCPLWASVGLVDGVRIASDVGVDWNGQLSAQSLLNDMATRNFGNFVLWQIDPDSILLRNHYHNLTDAEIRSLALYAGMSGGVCMTSDDLKALSGDRMRLWKFILSMDPGACLFPFLGSSSLSFRNSHPPAGQLADPVIVQVRPRFRGKAGETAIFALNTGEHRVQRTYRFTLLGLIEPLWVFDGIQGYAWAEATDRISFNLDPHEGKLFIVSDKPFINSQLPPATEGSW